MDEPVDSSDGMLRDACPFDEDNFYSAQHMGWLVQPRLSTALD